MKQILDKHDELRPHFEKGGKFEKLWPLFDAQDTFMFTPPETTHSGSHVRDAVDLKRVMITVVLALFPCILMGIWNAGMNYNTASGLDTGLVSNLTRGAILVLPIIFVSYAAGGFWEVLFACARRHEINEGFLVTGMLFPLTLPVTIPLWQVALGISFGVVIGKEVFGGTGMNVLNPALTARAFVFFSYPSKMAGDGIWHSVQDGAFGVSGFTGATPLSIVATLPKEANAVEALNESGYTFAHLFQGNIIGSIGETSTIACILGAAILLITGVGSWRIMASAVVGLFAGGFLMNAVGASPFMNIPPHYHLVLGGFAFGCVFMATDPVSAAATNVGKLIYGFLTGFLVVIIRIFNPAYMECVMLVILFMNVMAPLIDYSVMTSHMKRRTANV